MAKEFEKQSIQMEIQVQMALEKRGLESLRDMAATINTAIEAEVPKVFVGIQKKFTENPEVFLTGRVMGDIFARVEEHNTLFEKDLGAHVEEFKVELHSEKRRAQKKG